MAEGRPSPYRLIPVCRGPSREQSREHRGLRSRLVADAFGAPVLRDQGQIGQRGMARPIGAERTDECGHFGRYAVLMSQGPAPMQEVPGQHRFDYGGRCWWCGVVADSREHKHKKTDMTREFGPGPYIGDLGVVRGFEETLRPVQGPGSDELKFARVLCATCNNARSQPFDMAHDAFMTFVANNENSILRTRRFRFSDVYGGEWRSNRENLAKYYVKHVGCRLAQAGIKVEQPILDYRLFVMKRGVVPC